MLLVSKVHDPAENHSVITASYMFPKTFTHVLCDFNIVSVCKDLVKDGGSDPPTTCKMAAQQLADDPDIVGVVGGYRSSCSIASHQYFRDHGKATTIISF